MQLNVNYLNLVVVLPFSILNRIESNATPPRLVNMKVSPNFQYPQSDRIECNDVQLPNA